MKNTTLIDQPFALHICVHQMRSTKAYTKGYTLDGFMVSDHFHRRSAYIFTVTLAKWTGSGTVSGQGAVFRKGASTGKDDYILYRTLKVYWVVRNCTVQIPSRYHSKWGTMSGEGTIFRFRLKFTSDGNKMKIIQKQVNM